LDHSRFITLNQKPRFYSRFTLGSHSPNRLSSSHSLIPEPTAIDLIAPLTGRETEEFSPNKKRLHPKVQWVKTILHLTKIKERRRNMKRLALAIALVLGAGPQAWADLSIDQAPTEMAGIDPGDTFLPAMGPMVDDGDLVGFLPSLGVPGLLPGTPYDTDGFSQNIPNDPFAPTAGAPPGVLVSIDDGDIGPGAGPPDNATELFYSPLPPIGVSFPTKATESFFLASWRIRLPSAWTMTWTPTKTGSSPVPRWVLSSLPTGMRPDLSIRGTYSSAPSGLRQSRYASVTT
jgi:hypothetical protein